MPAQFAGLIASLLGMVIGSLAPQRLAGPLPVEPEHAFLHHHAAAETHHVPAPAHPHHPE